MIKISLLLTTFLLLVISIAAFAAEKKIYPTVESFKAQLSIGVREEKSLDINNDGKLDTLIYSYGGEETYLDILLREDNHYLLIGIPVAEEYKIINSPAGYEIRVGLGTFPSFGDVHGSDKYLWYDFYQVVGNTLMLSNVRHQKFYEKMIPLYRRRIKELEREIKEFEKKRAEGREDPSVLELYIQWRRDHIEKYQEFLKKASVIIEDTGKSKN